MENVEFLKGEIEHIPLPDNSVDVVISNCVINLSADKDVSCVKHSGCSNPVAGSRFPMSLPVAKLRRRSGRAFFCGSVRRGGTGDDEYRVKLSAAGFEQIDIEPTRIYRAEDAREFLAAEGIDADAIAPQVNGKFMSAFVRAIKPVAAF